MLLRPARGDVLTYVAAMLLLIAVGAVGALLHIQSDLSLNQAVIAERFLRGAPVMAPLLFCNMGLLGLIALLNPAEAPAAGETAL